MYSPEAYISELKQLFRMTTQKLSRAKLFNQQCHSTKVHLRPATELQLLQRPRTLANTKQQLTLPLRVRGIFF